jgi:predicted metal-dependent phosphotriesterase family hydrolase
MLGHDYAPAPVVVGEEPPAPEGQTRYLFVSNTAIPVLREMGVGEDVIHTMTVDVPRRFLSGEA